MLTSVHVLKIEGVFQGKPVLLHPVLIVDEIEIIHTPGHSTGHLSFYLPAQQCLIASDAIIVEHGLLEIVNPEFTVDLSKAVQSVEKLMEWPIIQLICYHGGIFEGNTGQHMKQLIRRYHRVISLQSTCTSNVL